jgi:E3 ubiquitin-protein ligase TRIP12
MHRSIPVGNKLCAERNRQREQELHQKRLKSMRPQVDTSEPQVVHLDHLRNNLKREQLLEERYFEIDRENKILLQKMSDIMRHTSYTSASAKSGPPSLNRDLRKTELMRITQENQAILKRIQKAQPIYNHVEWEDSYRRSATYLKNSAQVPSARGKSRENAFAMAGAATTSGDFRASPSSASALGSSCLLAQMVVSHARLQAARKMT